MKFPKELEKEQFERLAQEICSEYIDEDVIAMIKKAYSAGFQAGVTASVAAMPEEEKEMRNYCEWCIGDYICKQHEV